MKKNVVVGAILGSALLLFLGWYFASPSWAMSQLQTAATEGDTDRLEQSIDFPSVRESLKTELRAAMAAEMVKQQEDAEDGFAVLGSAFAMAMVDTMVDGFVNPESMAAMIEKGQMEREASIEAGEQSPREGQERDVEWSISREGISRFTATPVAGEGEPVPTLIFERNGIGWKLSAIDLPDGPLAQE